MKLLLDMNLSPRWEGFLLNQGMEAIHWSTVGRHDASDMEIMKYAVTHDCVVVTNDLDFSTILGMTRAHKLRVLPLF